MTGVADLHVHTTASDGTYTPVMAVNRARAIGLKAIGITDHDSMAGINLALEAGNQLNVEVIPGVELNTELGGHEIHLLGYYVELTPGFDELLNKLRSARAERIEEMIGRLQGLGLDISLERVLKIAGQASIGRPHLARAMVEKGYASSEREAFERFLNPGCPGYVERFKLLPQDAVRRILEARGIPVLAHPGLLGRDEIIPSLVECGLMGLEVFHSSHTPAMVSHYKKLARRHGLLITGGSDCHGPSFSQPALLGSVCVPYSVVVELKKARYDRL